MKKKLLSVVMAIVLVLSLTACGNKTNTAKENTVDTADTTTQTADTATDTTDTTDKSATSTTDKITVAIWDTNQQAGLQQIMDDWTAQSGIKAEIQVISWNEYWTLLEAGASGGSLPDVFWMHSNQAQKYMENGLLLDLTDKIAASDKVDMKNFYPDIVNLYTSNSKIYAMPKDIDTIGLWYNKKMFDDAGIAYPDDTWTWETLYETAKKLTKSDGSQFGYAANTSNNQDSYYNAIYAYGGYILNDDKTKSGYDDPKTIKAMKVYEKMLREGISPDLQTLSENGTEVLFESGKVAMITQGSWMVPAFRDNEYTSTNCDVAVLPTGPDGTRVSIYNGLGWAAAANGKNTDAAWSLIEYLGTKEAQLKQAELGVTMSAYQGTSEAWKNGVKIFHLQSYLDMLNAKLIFRPYSRNTTLWEDMATEELKAAWTGDATMEDTCKKIAVQMNTILADEK
jgi:multiple sugar transport system substrate-binding protein